MTSYQIALIIINLITIIINLISFYQMGKVEKRIKAMRDETESLANRIKKQREITMKIEPSDEMRELFESVKDK